MVNLIYLIFSNDYNASMAFLLPSIFWYIKNSSSDLEITKVTIDSSAVQIIVNMRSNHKFVRNIGIFTLMLEKEIHEFCLHSCQQIQPKTLTTVQEHDTVVGNYLTIFVYLRTYQLLKFNDLLLDIRTYK